MDNPYLREARGLKSFLSAPEQDAHNADVLKIKNVSFHQLINQHTDVVFPTGKGLKQKLIWARTNFSDKVSIEDYGHTPNRKINEWHKWKKLIAAAILKEIAESIEDTADNAAPAFIEGIVPEVSVNPAPPVVDVIVPMPGPEVSVNPAPPVVDVIVPMPEPEVSVNPAPPVVDVIVPMPEPEVSVNPAPPVVDVIVSMPEPEVSVNPAPPVVDVIVPMPEPEVSVNPAPPLIDVDLELEFIIRDDMVASPMVANNEQESTRVLTYNVEEGLVLGNMLENAQDELDNVLNSTIAAKGLQQTIDKASFDSLLDISPSELVHDVIFVE